MKLKKVTAVLLSAVMAISMLAGCGSGGSDSNSSAEGGNGTEAGTSDTGSEDGNSDVGGAAANTDVGDMTVVKLTIPSFGDVPDAPDVAAAVNEILAKKYGIQMELTYISSGAWTEQTNLMLTSADEIDVFALMGTSLSTYVKNGQLLALDDYFETASDDFKNMYPESYFDGTKVGGTLYSITNFRNYSNKFLIEMDTNVVEEMGIDPDSLDSLDAVEELLYEIKETYPDKYPMVPQSGTSMIGTWTWDGLGDEEWIGVSAGMGQSAKVENLFETDEFVEFVTRMRKWYNDGLIMADVLSNTEAGDTLVMNGKGFARFNNATYGEREGLTRSADIVEAWAQSNSFAAFSYAISSNSLVPDESWTLMEAIYTDAEIMNLLLNGIEGVHWTYTDENENLLTYPEGVTADTTGYNAGNVGGWWAYPNSYLTSPWEPDDPMRYEGVKEQDDNALVSVGTGFVFDLTDVTNEYAACINVKEKYYEALMSGAVDPETTIPQANEELYAAGLQKVLDEKQAQLDAFLADK